MSSRVIMAGRNYSLLTRKDIGQKLSRAGGPRPQIAVCPPSNSGTTPQYDIGKVCHSCYAVAESRNVPYADTQYQSHARARYIRRKGGQIRRISKCERSNPRRVARLATAAKRGCLEAEGIAPADRGRCGGA